MESAQALVGTVLKPVSSCLILPDAPSTNVKGTVSLASYLLASASEPASWRTQPAQACHFECGRAGSQGEV